MEASDTLKVYNDNITNFLLAIILVFEMLYLILFTNSHGFLFFYIANYLAIALFLFIPVFKRFIIYNENFRILNLGVLTIILSLISMLFTGMTNQSFYFVYSLLFLSAVITIQWHTNNIKLISNLSIILLGVCLFHSISPDNYDYYGRLLLYFNNPNSTGVLMYTIFTFLLIGFVLTKRLFVKSIYIISIIASLVLLYLSGNRGSIVSAIIILIIFLIINKKVFINKTLYKIICLTFLLIPFLTVVYIQFIFNSGIGKIELMGKDVFSGREIVWNNAISLISQSPLFGYGTEGSINLLGTGMHNIYVGLLMRYGLIVLVPYFILIYKLLIDSYNSINSTVGRIALFGFLGVFIQQSFEETLISGSFGLYILQYSLLAIAYSLSKSNKIF